MNKKVGTPFRLRNLHSEVMVDEDLDVGMKERERVMRKNAYAERDVYPTLKPDINEYKVLSNEDAFNQYLQASISVKIENCEWIKLNCFDSVSFDDSKSSMFFTGGPVQSSAFCPIPSHADQYIAVATSAILNNIDRHFSLSYVDTKSEKGLIQFWNLGCLQSTRLNQLPCMEFSLEHQNGFITAMKWCPKGLSLSEDGIAGSRLGLLALSCSDSYVRIYSVPHPNILQNKTAENASIYPAKPCLILNPLFSEPSSLTRKAIATCLDWHQNTEVVAAGYGNGCICVWMVKMISSPSTTIISMKKEDEYLSILPYLVFDASGTPITSVSFAPLDICQYLVCSSFDKTLKFFDLHDTSVPFCSIKRGFALNDCAWAKGFCGSMISLHDGITFKGSSFSKECGTEEFPAQNISGSVGSLTCSAISDVANMQALADINGTVSVNFFHHPCDLMKLPVFDTYVLFETEIVTIESNKAGADFEKEREVSLAVSDILDIVEVVNDEFSQYCEKISPDNPSEMKLPNIIYTKESTRLCYEPELMDLMSALLESVIENNALKDSAVEDTPVEICLENKLDGTNENKAISSISPIVLTNDDLKEKRYFPMEEMLNNSHTKQKKQLQIENDDNDKKNMKISDQPTLSKETICIDDSMSGNSVKDAPDAVLTNNVPEISSEEMSARSSSSAEFVNQHERNGANEILAQLSGGDAILQLTAESERVAITLQSVDPKHKTVSQQNIELECDVVPQKADEPDCDVVPQKIDEPDSLDCDVIVQQTAESDCHDVLQMKSDTDSSDTSNHGEESNFSDDSSLSMISECSYASNSCDSMQSFLSDSLVPDTPSESPIPTINKEEFLSPVSSSSIENKIVNSELRSIQEENCCSQQAEKEFESKPEINSKNSEEFGHNEIPGTTATQGTEKELENFTKNDEPNLIHMHINAADLPQTFDSDKQSSCLFEEEQKGNDVVTEHLSTEADSMQTVNEASSSTNAASTTDNTRMLESYSVEELASPDLSNEPQCSQTSEQILSNSSEETLGACNSDERINGHLLEERESPVSYASLIASCGLVFKDVNTSSTSSDEKKDHLPVENNVLSSVNAISWNPNIGCHSWLVTAGNSGIARLVCVSELGPQEENSLLE